MTQPAPKNRADQRGDLKLALLIIVPIVLIIGVVAALVVRNRLATSGEPTPPPGQGTNQPATNTPATNGAVNGATGEVPAGGTVFTRGPDPTVDAAAAKEPAKPLPAGEGQTNLTEVEGPVPADDDRDGLANTQEAALGTDPTKPDTDGDGKYDGDEVIEGTDPKSAASVKTKPAPAPAPTNAAPANTPATP